MAFFHAAGNRPAKSDELSTVAMYYANTSKYFFQKPCCVGVALFQWRRSYNSDNIRKDDDELFATNVSWSTDAVAF